MAILDVPVQLTLQVAFGSDFRQLWSDEDLGLKHVKGDGTLSFLIDHSFRGVQKSYRNPFYYVSCKQGSIFLGGGVLEMPSPDYFTMW